MLTDIVRDLEDRGLNPLSIVISGSKAYGTDNPDSDTDYRGVYAADTHDILGINRVKDTIELSEYGDAVFFELSKYVRLCIDGNPNVLETLFIEPHYSASPFAYLEGVRSYILSENVVPRYEGFAFGQMKNLENYIERRNSQKEEDFTKWDRRIEKSILHMFRLLEQLRRLKKENWLYVKSENPGRLLELSRSTDYDALIKEFSKELDMVRNIESKLRKKPVLPVINECVVRIRKALL